MTCWASIHIGEVKRKVDELGRKTSSDNADIQKQIDKGLQDIFEKISARLDDIELAIVDPHGEGYERIRKRHGKEKPRAVSPITNPKK